MIGFDVIIEKIVVLGLLVLIGFVTYHFKYLGAGSETGVAESCIQHYLAWVFLAFAIFW